MLSKLSWFFNPYFFSIFIWHTVSYRTSITRTDNSPPLTSCLSYKVGNEHRDSGMQNTLYQLSYVPRTISETLLLSKGYRLEGLRLAIFFFQNISVIQRLDNLGYNFLKTYFTVFFHRKRSHSFLDWLNFIKIMGSLKYLLLETNNVTMPTARYNRLLLLLWFPVTGHSPSLSAFHNELNTRGASDITFAGSFKAPSTDLGSLRHPVSWTEQLPGSLNL